MILLNRSAHPSTSLHRNFQQSNVTYCCIFRLEPQNCMPMMCSEEKCDPTAKNARNDFTFLSSGRLTLMDASRGCCISYGCYIWWLNYGWMLPGFLTRFTFTLGNLIWCNAGHFTRWSREGTCSQNPSFPKIFNFPPNLYLSPWSSSSCLCFLTSVDVGMLCQWQSLSLFVCLLHVCSWSMYSLWPGLSEIILRILEMTFWSGVFSIYFSQHSSLFRRENLVFRFKVRV